MSSSSALIGSSPALRTTHIATLETLAERDKEIGLLKARISDLEKSSLSPVHPVHSVAPSSPTATAVEDWKQRFDALNLTNRVLEVRCTKHLSDLSQIQAIMIMRGEQVEQLQIEVKRLMAENEAVKLECEALKTEKSLMLDQERMRIESDAAEKQQQIQREIEENARKICQTNDNSVKRSDMDEELHESELESYNEEEEQPEILDKEAARDVMQTTNCVLNAENQSTEFSKRNCRLDDDQSQLGDEQCATKREEEELAVLVELPEHINAIIISESNTLPDQNVLSDHNAGEQLHVISSLRSQVQELTRQMEFEKRQSRNIAILSETLPLPRSLQRPSIVSLEWEEKKQLLNDYVGLTAVEKRVRQSQAELIRNHKASLKLPRVSLQVSSSTAHRSGCVGIVKLQDECARLRQEKKGLSERIAIMESLQRRQLNAHCILPDSLAIALRSKETFR